MRPKAIADHLRQEILSGAYPPGSWLRERPIAELFQVSRGPIREAFRLLAAERIVEFEPFRGAHVAQLSSAEILEMFELRAALVGLAARLSAERASDEAIQDFQREVRNLAGLVNKGRPPKDLVTQGGMAASVLVRGCAAPELQQILRSLTRKSQWHYTHIGLRALATAREAVSHWLDAADALGKRDGQAAEAAIRRALRHVQEHSMAVLDAEGSFAIPPRPGSGKSKIVIDQV